MYSWGMDAPPAISLELDALLRHIDAIMDVPGDSELHRIAALLAEIAKGIAVLADQGVRDG